MWRKRLLKKSIVNLWKKKLPERNRVYGDPRIKVTTIMDLPEDVMVDILLRLPVKSLCRIQCVSKTSFDIAHSPGFSELHTLYMLDSATNSSNFECHRLILVTKSPNKNDTTSVALQSLEYSRGKIKLTKNRQSALVSKICFRKNSVPKVDFVYCNLLFFKRKCGVPWLLVNPLRGEALKLPALSNIGVRNTYYDLYGMGFDTITSTYKIVHVFPSDGNRLVAQVLELGSCSWRNTHSGPRVQGSMLLGGDRGIQKKKTICTHGYTHWLIYGINRRRHVVSFDFKKEELHIIPCPNSDLNPDLDWDNVNLLNFKGSLAVVDFVTIFAEYIKIWVLTSYEKKLWELRYKIETDELKCDIHRRYLRYNAETCVEWEHGICFASPETCYIVDLRRRSMRIVTLPKFMPSIFSKKFWTEPIKPRNTTSSIFGQTTQGLISLKHYGNVIKATKSEDGEWHID